MRYVFLIDDGRSFRFDVVIVVVVDAVKLVVVDVVAVVDVDAVVDVYVVVDVDVAREAMA